MTRTAPDNLIVQGKNNEGFLNLSLTMATAGVKQADFVYLSDDLTAADIAAADMVPVGWMLGADSVAREKRTVATRFRQVMDVELAGTVTIGQKARTATDSAAGAQRFQAWSSGDTQVGQFLEAGGAGATVKMGVY